MRVHSRSRPRSGREASLVAGVRRNLECGGYLTAQEVGIGYGVADLVAARISTRRSRIRLRRSQHQRLTRLDHFELLFALPEIGEGRLSLGDMAKVVGLSPDYTRRTIVSFLEKAGYMKEVEPGLFAKANGWCPIARELHAIEGKVSDWKKGAIQAKRHRLFAHRVYLALDHRFLRRVDPSLLRFHGIGLLSVTGERVQRILGSPRRVPRSSVHFNLVSEVFWPRIQRKVAGGSKGDGSFQ